MSIYQKVTDLYKQTFSLEQWERLAHEHFEPPEIDWPFVFDKYPEVVTKDLTEIQPMHGAMTD